MISCLADDRICLPLCESFGHPQSTGTLLIHAVRLLLLLVFQTDRRAFPLDLLTLHAPKQEWLSPFLHISEFSLQELSHANLLPEVIQITVANG